jgi:hypothetical protein
MPEVHAPSAWLESLFVDLTECAWARTRPQKSITGLSLSDNSFPSPREPCRKPSRHLVPRGPSDSPRSFEPYPEFFQRLAQLVVDCPLIGRLISDDKTSSVIWGETYTPLSSFLQMCIRDRHMKCFEIWWKLDSRTRQELIEVSKNGPPSPDYFYKIMVSDQYAHRTPSQNGSSDNDSASLASSQQFRFR